MVFRDDNRNKLLSNSQVILLEGKETDMEDYSLICFYPIFSLVQREEGD